MSSTDSARELLGLERVNLADYVQVSVASRNHPALVQG